MKKFCLCGLFLLFVVAAGCSKNSDTAGAAKSAAKDAGQIIAKNAEKVGEEAKELAKKAGEMSADATITAAVKLKFANDDKVSATKINVDTKDGMVTLNGQVASKQEADRAVELARSVDGVKRVTSNLMVPHGAEPVSHAKRAHKS
ncbi:MAG TPA: BON domain-containing protein [Acidobacteriota bacterium]|jgi:osmotically-inducible protein OsmY